MRAHPAEFGRFQERLSNMAPLSKNELDVAMQLCHAAAAYGNEVRLAMGVHALTDALHARHNLCF
jgi:hypothetical protein